MTNSLFSALVLTLFPEMFPGMLGHSLAGKALKKGLWNLNTLQIRDFATDKHQTVDDTPYGGGAGMVMRPDVLDAAIKKAQTLLPEATLIYFTPRGTPLTQKMACELSQKPLILLCGRYEGVDQRLLDTHQPLEISIGDYVLSGGEIAAQVLLDACVRLLPGVIGDNESLGEESFSQHADFAGLLEYPHYTKPPIWDGRKVPDVLLSGDHAKIRDWRRREAEKITKARRPDLLKKDIEG
jgi:tRNA (guanine37-N1)-methyltransferase